MTPSQPLHATLVARYRRGEWRGVLLRGPSGAGKSGLALSLLGLGWRLVADDRVLVWRSDRRVFGRAPDTLFGLLEVRTVGVISRAALRLAGIDAVVDCAPDPKTLERIPQSATVTLEGVRLPNLRLDARSPGAAEKVAAFCGVDRL